MHMSKNGIAFLKRWEGLVKNAYRDVAGVWTIGYGHTAGFRDGRLHKDSMISEAGAEQLLREDLRSREETVSRLVTIPINQNEFDALVSFEFNTGALHRATALKLFNTGNKLAAAEALTWWNKARIDGKLEVVPGLTRRRAAEADLLLRPVRKNVVKSRPILKTNSKIKKTPAKRRRLCLSFGAPTQSERK